MVRKSKPQYPATRKLGGEVFRFNHKADTKRGAVAIKMLLQDDGYLVRIVPHYDVYLLYTRRK